MLFHFTSRIVSASSAFLYPAYASYKTLSQRPASEEELERWLMYWSVLGCVVAVEYVAEWLVSWVPFYYTLKTLFLLYLALPQTKGSTYLYLSHLQPFFHTHESQIDSTLASLKGRAKAFVQERLRLLWEAVAVAIGQQTQAQASQQNNANIEPEAGSGPAQLLGSLWTSYGPGILASGTALLWQGASRLPTGPGAAMGTGQQQQRVRPQAAALTTPPGSTFRGQSSSSTLSLLDRKRQLEAELAALNAAAGADTSSIPMPSASPPLLRGSPDSTLRGRERTTSGRFEEVEVPSDVEGYDVGDDGVGHSRPGQQQRKGSGWFGGWAGGAAAKGYEKVNKND
ncbi:receptor expression-enhancing protein 4 [Ephemerocybe angulata]|uniref:Protein YOP1 n=1 Tax=Ephemerocybe angulata TaxID=980116 RepID=A0A8H6H7S8_9AGAR|nr:receptor expression-enhancing protein 4 [Tulosesus angulatus]